MSQYAVIKNPQALFNKFQVWYRGKEDVVDHQHIAVATRDVCKPVKAFRTQQEAEGYIQYQMEVKAFKEAV